MGEVPADLHVWTKPPEVLYRQPAPKGPGQPRKLPRLKKQNNPTVEAQNVATYSPLFRREDWQNYRVKDGAKGPMVWQAKRIRVWLKDEHGLPTAPHHLVVARNVLDPQEVKYFLSNAPEDTPVEPLLLVAFSRWKIERMFEDGKGELGLDHFEVRKYLSIERHLILSCVSYLFLAEFQREHRGGKFGTLAVPSPHRHGPTGSDVVSWGPLFEESGPDDPAATTRHPGAQRQSPTQPPQTHPSQVARSRTIFEGLTQVSLASFVAL